MRRFVGNHGYSHPLAGQMLVQLYRTLRLYVNYFQPSFKLLEKSREGSGRVKRYSPPATPSDRLLQHQAVSDETKGQLTRDRASVDPAVLLHAIREPRAALVAVSSPDHGEPARQESLEQFLSLLPTLWQQGENRPTRAPRTRGPRHWRTRPDPFDGVWQDILGWLETDINARKILDRLCSEQPRRFSDHHFRSPYPFSRVRQSARYSSTCSVVMWARRASPAPRSSGPGSPRSPPGSARSSWSTRQPGSC